MSVPVKIVVVYHSGYGHTVKIAEAVARGAAAINGASVELIAAEKAPGRWELLDGADAIIMGAPTYMGSLSAPFKAFMDATSHLQYAEKRWEGKIAPTPTRTSSTATATRSGWLDRLTWTRAATSLRRRPIFGPPSSLAAEWPRSRRSCRLAGRRSAGRLTAAFRVVPTIRIRRAGA